MAFSKKSLLSNVLLLLIKESNTCPAYGKTKVLRNELSSASVSNSSKKYDMAVLSLVAMLSIICSMLEDEGSSLSFNVQCCIGLIVYSKGISLA